MAVLKIAIVVTEVMAVATGKVTAVMGMVALVAEVETAVMGMIDYEGSDG